VIAAAGSGERLGAGGPKAFIEVAGRTMLGWCLEAFAAAPTVRSAVVAVPPGYEDGKAAGLAPAPAGLPLTWVGGGASRSESVVAALERVESDLVVVHDAARPMVTAGLIDDVVGALAADSGLAGVVAARPLTDTVKRSGEARQVERTMDRATLWGAQTPQAFRTDALRQALGSAPSLAAATDDAALVERAGGVVLLHESPSENIKVTTELDLRLAELILGGRRA
jgi:2-C-methyl-D-erythritol 4-phosphate cytidylyltransferase